MFLRIDLDVSSPPCDFSATAMAKHCPDAQLEVSIKSAVRLCKAAELLNGDVCAVGQWALVRTGDLPLLGRVHEIIDITGTTTAARQQKLLVHACSSPSHLSSTYAMPEIPRQREWIIADQRVRVAPAFGRTPLTLVGHALHCQCSA